MEKDIFQQLRFFFSLFVGFVAFIIIRAIIVRKTLVLITLIALRRFKHASEILIHFLSKHLLIVIHHS